MTPSVFASFIVFIVIGFVTTIKYNFQTDTFVRCIVVGVVIFSALYYYYLNIATAQVWPIKQQVSKYAKATWWITAAQYLGFLLLWRMLNYRWWAYSATLVFLNGTYIVWDCLHLNIKQIFKKKCDLEGRLTSFWDIAGFLLSIAFFCFTFRFPGKVINDNETAHHAMAIILVGAFLIFQSISGLVMAGIVFKYSPFKLLFPNGIEINKKNVSGSSGGDNA